MPKVRCPKCKTFYEFSGLPPKCCTICAQKYENDYQLVRTLVKENPGIAIQEVEDVTGIARDRILSYIREERLEIISSVSSFLKCELCNKQIVTGSRCDECKHKYGVEEKPQFVAKFTEVDEKMHIKGKNKK